MTAPNRSALFSLSARKTMPLRPDFLHCASRWRSIMPRGDEEEIAVRVREVFRFVALLATRALMERPTLNPSLIRDQQRLMASITLNRPALIWELCLGQRTYANLVADARFQSSRPIKHRPGCRAAE